MTMDSERLVDAVELIAASAWATEAVLRALERGEVHDAASLLADARRPLLQGLRELGRLLDADLAAGHHRGAGEVTARALEGVVRLEELIARRVA